MSESVPMLPSAGGGNQQPDFSLPFVTDNRMMNQLPIETGEGLMWPPPAFSPIRHTMSLWNAWWNGDPHMLSWVYFNLGENSPVGRSFFATTGEKNSQPPNAGQYRGGLIGGVDYTFWGNPVPPGEKRNKLHIPLAKKIARTSANLLFSKAPKFGSTIDNDDNENYLNEKLDQGLHTTLLSAAESCAALGGVYLRVTWNSAVRNCAWVEAVAADMCIPEFTSGVLTAVTFHNELDKSSSQHPSVDNTATYRHLERHDLVGNSISHGLYQGNEFTLGEAVPLHIFPQTAGFSTNVGGEGVGCRIELPDLGDACTVVYVPNMLPNQVWRDLPGGVNLGTSDFSGVEGFMDALDEAYSELRTELQLTRTKIMVPTSFIDNLGKGKGGVYEPARQVYVPMDDLQGDDGAKIDSVQLNIRYQEYLATITELYQQVISGAGYSLQTFGDYQGNAPTATEIRAREKQTNITRMTKTGLWNTPLREILYALMVVDSTYFNFDVMPERPEVTFSSFAENDDMQLAATVTELLATGATSLETRIKVLHPDWTQDQVDEEMAIIRQENGQGITPPVEPPSPIKPLQAIRAAGLVTKLGEDSL